MIKIEDFENAPVGATATRADGSRAMKTYEDGWSWVTLNGRYLGDKEMEYLDYTLDQPASSTVHEAVELVWELAHEVKEGQVIPEGAWLVERRDDKITVEKNTFFNISVDEWGEENIRTVEPLPDPDPDWIDAPAVIAVCNDTMDRDVFIRRGDGSWRSEFYGAETADLRDVVPLYPKEEEGEWVSL